MSEEATPATPGKKSKLPLIVALLLVFAGGGFFAFKGQGAAKKVEVKASAEAPEALGEFLVNLSGGTNVYLRAEISLRLREGFKKEALTTNKDAIKDAVNSILRSKTLQEVGAPQTPALKHEIATAINRILMASATPEEQKAQKELEKLAEPGNEKDDKAAKTEAPEFDSAAGPILNVYFTSFATQ